MMRVQHMSDVQARLLQQHLPRHRGDWSLADYRLAHEAACRKLGVDPHVLPGAKLFMHVNHNRWVAVCTSCYSGLMTGRGWSEGRCFGCGAIFSVVWPGNVDAIEALLSRRPIVNRNWSPGETLDALVADNIEHGVFAAKGA